jgi:ribosomal protein L32
MNETVKYHKKLFRQHTQSFEWKRKKNNHELFLDGVKVGSISGKTINFSMRRTERVGGMCDCSECSKESTYVSNHTVEFTCYYKGKNIGTFSNILEAMLNLESYVKDLLC